MFRTNYLCNEIETCDVSENDSVVHLYHDSLLVIAFVCFCVTFFFPPRSFRFCFQTLEVLKRTKASRVVLNLVDSSVFFFFNKMTQLITDFATELKRQNH